MKTVVHKILTVKLHHWPSKIQVHHTWKDEDHHAKLFFCHQFIKQLEVIPYLFITKNCTLRK